MADPTPESQRDGVIPRLEPGASLSDAAVRRLHWALDQGLVSVRHVASHLDVTIEALGELFDRHGLTRPFDL